MYSGIIVYFQSHIRKRVSSCSTALWFIIVSTLSTSPKSHQVQIEAIHVKKPSGDSHLILLNYQINFKYSTNYGNDIIENFPNSDILFLISLPNSSTARVLQSKIRHMLVFQHHAFFHYFLESYLRVESSWWWKSSWRSSVLIFSLSSSFQ